MARDEQHREDLLAEATALVERAEIVLAGEDDSTIIGFRRDGSASCYFGEDPAYHFNSAGELRRAFYDRRIYKAECRRLVSLERRRLPGEVQLVRHELTDEEAKAFVVATAERLERLQSAFANGTWRLIGQVSHSGDALDRIRRWLDQLVVPPPIAQSPRAK